MFSERSIFGLLLLLLLDRLLCCQEMIIGARINRRRVAGAVVMHCGGTRRERPPQTNHVDTQKTHKSQRSVFTPNSLNGITRSYYWGIF